MINEGDEFTDIPVVYVEAQDLKEAKAKALEVSSQYGEITQDSFLAYSDDLVVDFDIINIPNIENKEIEVNTSEEDDLELVSDFQIIISCKTLEEQEQTFNHIKELGYQCKTLNL